jgi:hypothetical protein
VAQLMTDPAEGTPPPSVLVIAANDNIEALAGELVAFAGYRPSFDATNGAAGESIRRTRPDIALLDTALPRDVVRSCVDAADESGSRVVLMSSNGSAHELEVDARGEHCLHFVLPGGPRQLAGVLECALERRPLRERLAPGAPMRHSARPGSIQSALCAALANVARARILIARAALVREDAALMRETRRELFEETQRSRAALRAAVSDYTSQLRRANLSEDEAVMHIQESIAECAAAMDPGMATGALLDEAASWVVARYRAA